MNKHSHNCLSGQYVTDGADLTGNHGSEGTLIFLLQNLELVINLKKTILQPVKQLEFLRLQINTEEMTLSLLEEKLTHIIQQRQEIGLPSSTV